MVKLTLFGTAAAAVDDRPIHFRTDKIRALLVYLAMEGGRPHERQSLAALLWPEMPEETALKNLRQSLHRLQKAMDERLPGSSEVLFHITRRTVLSAPGTLDVDAVRFQELLSACETHPHRRLHLCRDCLDRLSAAVALYQGELLAGFGLPDAFPFEEWLLVLRERLHSQAVSALGQLAAALGERGELEAAIGYAQRQVALDPLREEAHRLVMRLYARGKEFGKALAQYESLRRLLQAELGVEPAAETMTLHHQVLAEQRGEAAGTKAGSGPASLFHFPVQFTPFIGRQRELAEIEEWFLEPDARLLTLVGPGGVGKTRLAVRAGEVLAERGGFPDGIYFFPLASVRTVESLLTSLLNGLAAVSAGRGPVQASLIDHLRDRRCLLVLDNFDQLVEHANLLAELLAEAPGVRLLVASQLLLGLRAERRLNVGGLDTPGEGDEAAEALAFSAVRLFVETARQTDPSFRLDRTNEAAVRQICRLVDGHPLALELSAAWVRVMDCDAILLEIGRSLDFLSLSPQDRPDRHQSMAAVFSYAWRLLPQTEQTVLGQLAVFRGPFNMDAATTITEATPLALARLIDRSLLQRRKDGFYELHELLRQFVTRETAGRTKAAARRHSEYYLDLIAGREKDFYGPQPRRAAAAVLQVLSNVRQAWRWAIEEGHKPAIERSFEALGRFYQVAALIEEGRLMFEEAAARILDMPGLLGWQAFFLYKLGRAGEAVRLAEGALEQTAEDTLDRAELLSLLGELLPRAGRFEEAKRCQLQAIAMFQAASDLERQAKALRRLVSITWRAGDFEETLRYFQQALPIHTAIEDKRGLAQLYNMLAGYYFDKNEVDRSLAYVQKAGELFEAIEEKLDAAIINGNLARLYARLGRFEDALAANGRAMQTSIELGDRSGLERDLSCFGAIHAAIGEFDRSLDYYFQAIEIARGRKDQARIADFQAGVAAVYSQKGDDDTALSYYDLALPVLEAHGIPYHTAGPLIGKAELLLRRGSLAEARALGERVSALAGDAELHEFVHRSRLLEVRMNHLEGNTMTGLRQLSGMLAETNDELEQAELHYEMWKLTGERTPAEAALAGYRQSSGRVPSHVNRSRLAELQAFVAGG